MFRFSTSLFVLFLSLSPNSGAATTLWSRDEDLKKPLSSISIGDQLCIWGGNYRTFYVFDVDQRKQYEVFDLRWGKDDNRNEKRKYAALISLSENANLLSNMSSNLEVDDFSVLKTASIDETKPLGKDQLWLNLGREVLSQREVIPTKEKSSTVSIAAIQRWCMPITKLSASVVSTYNHQGNKKAKVRLKIGLKSPGNLVKGIDLVLENFPVNGLLKDWHDQSEAAAETRQALTKMILSKVSVESFLIMASPLGHPELKIKNLE